VKSEKLTMYICHLIRLESQKVVSVVEGIKRLNHWTEHFDTMDRRQQEVVIHKMYDSLIEQGFNITKTELEMELVV